MNAELVSIRPSGALSYDECGYAYYLKYVLKVKPEFVSANLCFGTAIHKAFTDYILALTAGVSNFNPIEVFKEKWDEAQSNQAMEFSATFEAEDFTQIGIELANQIPDAWGETGFIPFIDAEGPVVERRFEVVVGHNVILSGEPDILVMDSECETLIIDVKSTAATYTEEFALASDQLTDYQLLAENPSSKLGLDECGVSGLGFFEMVKRKIPKTKLGKGPEIKQPIIVPRRTKARCMERVQRLNWLAEDIRRKRFPKKARMAYNSPCNLCEFRNYCLKGDPTGLIFPRDKSSLASLAGERV